MELRKWNGIALYFFPMRGCTVLSQLLMGKVTWRVRCLSLSYGSRPSDSSSKKETFRTAKKTFGTPPSSSWLLFFRFWISFYLVFQLHYNQISRILELQQAMTSRGTTCLCSFASFEFLQCFAAECWNMFTLAKVWDLSLLWWYIAENLTRQSVSSHEPPFWIELRQAGPLKSRQNQLKVLWLMNLAFPSLRKTSVKPWTSYNCGMLRSSLFVGRGTSWGTWLGSISSLQPLDAKLLKLLEPRSESELFALRRSFELLLSALGSERDKVGDAIYGVKTTTLIAVKDPQRWTRHWYRHFPIHENVF